MECHGSEQVLATEFLDIDQISIYTKEYALPYFNTNFIDMYTQPSNLRFNYNKSNDYFIESFKAKFNLIEAKNSAYEVNKMTRSFIPTPNLDATDGYYVSRLLIGIDSEELYSYKNDKSKAPHLNMIPREEFVCFVLINEAYMIDPRYKTDLNFRLCIGKINSEFKPIENLYKVVLCRHKWLQSNGRVFGNKFHRTSNGCVFEL